jgi:hypothetical protein
METRFSPGQKGLQPASCRPALPTPAAHGGAGIERLRAEAPLAERGGDGGGADDVDVRPIKFKRLYFVHR